MGAVGRADRSFKGPWAGLGGPLRPYRRMPGRSPSLLPAQRLWATPIPGIGRGRNPGEERSTRR